MSQEELRKNLRDPDLRAAWGEAITEAEASLSDEERQAWRNLTFNPNADPRR